MCYDESQTCFLVLSNLSPGFSSSQARTSLINMGCPSSKPVSGNKESFEQGVAADIALRYLTYIALRYLTYHCLTVFFPHCTLEAMHWGCWRQQTANVCSARRRASACLLCFSAVRFHKAMNDSSKTCSFKFCWASWSHTEWSPHSHQSLLWLWILKPLRGQYGAILCCHQNAHWKEETANVWHRILK